MGTQMKKRTTSLLLCLALLFVFAAFSACSGNGSGISSSADLKNKKIGAIQGTAAYETAKSFVKNGCELIPYSGSDELNTALALGAVDCVITDNYSAKKLAANDTSLKVLDEVLDESELVFNALKSKKVYIIMLNKAIAALKENGTLDRIIDAYVNDSGEKFDFSTAPDDSNGTFTIALSSGLAPFAVKTDSDTLDGVEPAYIYELCKQLGCGYMVADISATMINEALRGGLCDFALGSYDIANAVNVEEIMSTDPILTLEHVIVTK